MGEPGTGALAAVDCGTNSTRLLVADLHGAPLERRMRITRLGAGVDRRGRLDTVAIGRTITTLREFRRVMDRYGVGDVFASATSAVRDASNAADFLTPATEVLGTAPRVLQGSEEGALSYRGATGELAEKDGPFLLVDVGGGSTELVTAGGAGEIVAVSLDVGCVRVSERFLVSDPPREEEEASAHEHVAALVRGAVGAHPELAAARLMVGVAGTVSALAVLELGLSGYDREKVHHARLSRSATRRLFEELSGEPLAERRERPGMEKERADVIVGGALVLVTVMELLGHDELLVSESDILDGMVGALREGRDAGRPSPSP
ncbi:MAG: exopolyphosphatase [Actinomycetota bacterium]|nr:exopolyphosphatase [Actinomycetota bacterium]